jgi:glycosyltransferase involved in cell wall biosynthesis
MKSLSFSIVTPSFNQAAFIEDALASVRQQQIEKVEHWVIDGGSSDGTVDLLRRHSDTAGGKQLRWLSEPDGGQSEALNKGFSLATGDIVGWLNSDDRYRSGCFEQVANIFMRHPDVDIVYGDYTWMDEQGRVFRIRREIEFNHFVLLYHRVLYIPSTATFFRRRIFQEGNRLNEVWQYAMDFDFFLMLASRGYRYRHIPAVLADFRFHRNSKTCATPHKQLEEVDNIARLYSPLLSRMKAPATRRLTLAMLRSCAGALRYSEKLFRGYYFDRFRFSTIDS